MCVCTHLVHNRVGAFQCLVHYFGSLLCRTFTEHQLITGAIMMTFGDGLK